MGKVQRGIFRRWRQENEDRPGKAAFAQFQGLLHGGNGEHIRQALQRARHSRRAQAIAIGLHHRQ